VIRDGTVAEDGRIEVQAVVGSVQERTLLDHLYRNPEIVNAKVSTIMDPPFSLVDANEEIERVFPLLTSGSPAVLVEREGCVIGVVTRADLLEFAAHQSRELRTGIRQRTSSTS
jgi:cystathionine beta-synthase